VLAADRADCRRYREQNCRTRRTAGQQRAFPRRDRIGSAGAWWRGSWQRSFHSMNLADAPIYHLEIAVLVRDDIANTGAVHSPRKLLKGRLNGRKIVSYGGVVGHRLAGDRSVKCVENVLFCALWCVVPANDVIVDDGPAQSPASPDLPRRGTLAPTERAKRAEGGPTFEASLAKPSPLNAFPPLNQELRHVVQPRAIKRHCVRSFSGRKNARGTGPGRNSPARWLSRVSGAAEPSPSDTVG